MSSPGTRIAELRLRSIDPEASVQFLRLLLPGLEVPPQWPGVAKLTFSPGEPPQSAPPNTLPAFWKLSVFTDDIVGLAKKLRSAGVAVTEPVQFGDIGYLCHLQEPGSNAIELIQRTFQDGPALGVKSPDTLGLITLRVSDPQESAQFYVDALGMQMLAMMSVDDGRPDPFDLYFFGYPDAEIAPDSDPASVANREWLYQRRSTLIELQHYRRPTPELQQASDTAPALHLMLLETNDLEAFVHRLHSQGVSTADSDDGVVFVSPDGHQFRCHLSKQ